MYFVGVAPSFLSWNGELLSPPGTADKLLICACEAISLAFWNCGPCSPSKSGNVSIASAGAGKFPVKLAGL